MLQPLLSRNRVVPTLITWRIGLGSKGFRLNDIPMISYLTYIIYGFKVTLIADGFLQERIEFEFPTKIVFDNGIR